MKTFSLVSLGCPKNLVDSETMVGRLIDAGWEFRVSLDKDRPCDVVVLNTCGFLASARDEARDYVAELLQWKNEGRIGRIVVTGCMVRHDARDDGGQSLVAEFPGVDAWLGVVDERKIVETLQILSETDNSETGASRIDISKIGGPGPLVRLEDVPALVLDDRLRKTLTLPHVAYLKIADGCNRLCSFCAIPSIRGRFVSKPLETVVEEAEKLAASGVKELILVAQETTFYGSDLYGGPRLAELLRRLEDVAGFRWIRLMYTYPLFFDDELLERFTDPGAKLLPYIDIPLQHCNRDILKRMRRAVDPSQTEALLDRLRSTIPNLVLRTSLIVGFPGETEAMFDELVAFVKRWKFERAGVFAFSPESGTHAATLGDRVAGKAAQRRYRTLFNSQDRIARGYAASLRGRTLDVLIDTPYIDETGSVIEGVFLGRTVADAPDVDPVVFVTGNVEPGTIVPCEIVETQGIHLVAVASET